MVKPTFFNTWLKCRRCGLWRWRRVVVIDNQTLPTKILFLGEAPGKVEDLVGLPFQGLAGIFLKSSMFVDAQRLANLRSVPPHFFANVVACRPTDSKDGDTRKPSDFEAKRCRFWINKLLKTAKPKRVVLLGKVAEKTLINLVDNPVVLPHPAFFVRSGRRQAPGYQATIRKLAKVFKEVS